LKNIGNIIMSRGKARRIFTRKTLLIGVPYANSILRLEFELRTALVNNNKLKIPRIKRAMRT